MAVFGFQQNGMELDISAADSSEDEQRENEIKKLLEEGLCNETFDYDTDNSIEISEPDVSRLKEKSFNLSEGSLHSLGKRQSEKKNMHQTNGISENRMLETNNNESAAKTYHSGDQLFSASTSSRFKTVGNTSNSNDTNGHENTNSSKSGNGTQRSLARDIKNAMQSDRENEEIEARNPTISLMHTNHCPQNDNNDLDLGSSMWLSSDNNIEQLKTLCKFRERQMLRSEETIATLTKDKRSLNHQLGLMKSEMVQMKTQHGELENLLRIRDEEVVYLKSKIREAVEEYDQVRRREICSKDECSRLLSEVEKLQQEVKLLSAIGTSTQQGEVDQLVRQMREKHARDTASWQKVVNELEGQIRLYKRAQQLLHEESFAVSKNNVEVQTEDALYTNSDSEDREREQAEKEFRNEFGAGDGNSPASGKLRSSPLAETNLHDSDAKLKVQIEEYKSQWELEKKEIINFYEIEIDAYRSRLTSLPAKLYETWQKTQNALGISSPSKKKPESKNVATCTDVEIVSKSAEPEKNTVTQHSITSLQSFQPADMRNNDVDLLADGIDNKVNTASPKSNDSKNGSANEVEPSSALIQTDHKETSSVIIQTEETLETYKILSGLIEQWAAEVAQNSERAQNAEYQVKIADEELNKLRKRFKGLQRMASSCRKEWKKQEDCLKKRNSDLKDHYVQTLLKLNDKLELLDIE